jgi:hypothetical protein
MPALPAPRLGESLIVPSDPGPVDAAGAGKQQETLGLILDRVGSALHALCDLAFRVVRQLPNAIRIDLDTGH